MEMQLFREFVPNERSGFGIKGFEAIVLTKPL
jgi:hypothetical protein